MDHAGNKKPIDFHIGASVHFHRAQISNLKFHSFLAFQMQAIFDIGTPVYNLDIVLQSKA